MDSREERLMRMRAGLPAKASNRKLSDTAVAGLSVSARARGGTGTNFELSDNAANLIAKAVKTLLNS